MLRLSTRVLARPAMPAVGRSVVMRPCVAQQPVVASRTAVACRWYAKDADEQAEVDLTIETLAKDKEM